MFIVFFNRNMLIRLKGGGKRSKQSFDSLSGVVFLVISDLTWVQKDEMKKGKIFTTMFVVCLATFGLFSCSTH
jgi:hypothetical protein